MLIKKLVSIKNTKNIFGIIKSHNMPIPYRAAAVVMTYTNQMSMMKGATNRILFFGCLSNK